MEAQVTSDWLPLSDAAARLGLAVDTLRRKIKRGEVEARQIPTVRGYKWEVKLSSAPTMFVEVDHQPRPVQVGSQGWPDLSPLLQVLRDQQVALQRKDEVAERKDAELAALQNERAELFGRLGFYQAQIQAVQAQLADAQETIKLLQAPAAQPEPKLEPDALTVVTPAADAPAEQPRPWWWWVKVLLQA